MFDGVVGVDIGVDVKGKQRGVFVLPHDEKQNTTL